MLAPGDLIRLKRAAEMMQVASRLKRSAQDIATEYALPLMVRLGSSAHDPALREDCEALLRALPEGFVRSELRAALYRRLEV